MRRKRAAGQVHPGAARRRQIARLQLATCATCFDVHCSADELIRWKPVAGRPRILPVKSLWPGTVDGNGWLTPSPPSPCLEKVFPEERKLVAHALLEVAPQVDTEVTSRIMNDLRKIPQSLLDLPDGVHLE